MPPPEGGPAPRRIAWPWRVVVPVVAAAVEGAEPPAAGAGVAGAAAGAARRVTGACVPAGAAPLARGAGRAPWVPAGLAPFGTAKDGKANVGVGRPGRPGVRVCASAVATGPT